MNGLGLTQPWLEKSGPVNTNRPEWRDFFHGLHGFHENLRLD